jgi:hypothetical protein
VIVHRVLLVEEDVVGAVAARSGDLAVAAPESVE